VTITTAHRRNQNGANYRELLDALEANVRDED